MIPLLADQPLFTQNFRSTPFLRFLGVNPPFIKGLGVHIAILRYRYWFNALKKPKIISQYNLYWFIVLTEPRNISQYKLHWFNVLIKPSNISQYRLYWFILLMIHIDSLYWWRNLALFLLIHCINSAFSS